MKIKNLILLTSFLLIGSQVISSQSRTVDLPVIDISKKYQKKDIILQDIADIEYIPLETTDDVLLGSRPILSCVSDKYILVHETIRGDIFVFDHTGKIVSHFNRKGQSGMEYTWIGNGGTILDEKNKEIFVCSQSIQVYSLNGEYKRTLKINTLEKELKVFNFDDETLLVYEDVIVDPGIKDKDKAKKNPYSLISKKDGSLISVLNIQLPKRYSNRIVEMVGKGWREIMVYYESSMYYGQDFAIADISSDTLYLLTQNKKLTPLLTRKPSVHASSEPKTIWTSLLTTDKFILISTILLDHKSSGRTPVLMHEFKTGETSAMSILDAEYGMKKWAPGASPVIAKNRTASLIQASSIINAYKKKQLKGDLEKFAKTLAEDDNPIVRIIKFK